MAKAKAAKKITPAVLSKLIVMADGLLASDYCNGYLYRAEEDKAWFFGQRKTIDGNINPMEKQFTEGLRFGQLWKDYDYAFRQLMNPEHRAALAAALDGYNTFRKEHPEADMPTFDVAETTALCNQVLDGLAKAQPVDVIMGVEYDEFWDEFAGIMMDYVTTGEIADYE